MGMQDLISKIPDYDVFLTVDELNAELKKLAGEYPGKVAVFEAGISRAGSEILGVKVGNGSRNALFYGCPHPNEPIGAMMSRYFARAIAEDDEYREKLDFTFYIIPVIDVDGTRLNEGWFKGPFTVYNYARNYFRPASEEQVEWTFPMDYKTYSFNAPMPETRALMKIIDETKPVFIYSLHNAGFGGAYWYISGAQDGDYYASLHAAAKNRVPLDLGEPEMPFMIKLSDAVFKMPRATDIYDYFEQYTPGDPAEKMMGGECSGAYAGEDTVELVTELPYFYEPRVESGKLMDFPRIDAVERKLKLEETHIAALEGYLNKIKPLYSPENPFGKMVEQTVVFMKSSIEGERAFSAANEAFKEPCKESEAFSNIQLTKFRHLLDWGLLIRSVEFELDGAAENETLKAVLAEAESCLKDRAEQLENELDYKVIPIRDLVAVQLESGLQTLERI